MSLQYIKKLREMIQTLQLADKLVTWRYGVSPHATITVEQLLDSFALRVGRTSRLLLVVQHLVRDLKAEALTVDWSQSSYKDLADSPDPLCIEWPSTAFEEELQTIICEDAKEMGCYIRKFRGDAYAPYHEPYAMAIIRPSAGANNAHLA